MGQEFVPPLRDIFYVRSVPPAHSGNLVAVQGSASWMKCGSKSIKSFFCTPTKYRA
jgi:hypothetical protein